MIKRICSKRIRNTWEIQGNREVVRESCMTEGKEREKENERESEREREKNRRELAIRLKRHIYG